MNAESQYYDALETRAPEAREGALLARLPELVGHAVREAPGWARHLRGVDARAVDSRKALAALPVLRKGQLKGLQQADPPFGGLTTVPPGRLGHIYMSPGPIFDPEGPQADPWRVARALWAAGVRPGQVLQNCFGYHLTPGAWMVDHAARKLGCAVIPAGTGQTEQQIEVIRTLRPDAYVGTPSFLRIIIEKARELDLDIGNMKRALLAAEALPASLRQWFREQGVATVLQWYGTADLGCVAYESEAMEGMILEEDVLLEIVRPGTGDPVPDGEVGEIVITRFDPHYPLIRFGTGDLSAVMAGESPCGRNMLIRRRYGGYYLDAGGADLIIRGEIGLLQFEQIDRFVPEGARLKDGSIVPADLIVLATGFVDQEAVITKLLGEAVAKKVGPVWGIAPDGEMNNMWKRTRQEGLWFIGGSFANCRIYSRYVGLQIKAIEEGLLKFDDPPLQ